MCISLPPPFQRYHKYAKKKKAILPLGSVLLTKKNGQFWINALPFKCTVPQGAITVKLISGIPQ